MIYPHFFRRNQNNFVICNLDSAKLPFDVVQWMTESSIRSKLFAIADLHVEKKFTTQISLDIFIIDDDMSFVDIKQIETIIDNDTILKKIIGNLNIFIQSSKLGVSYSNIANKIEKDKNVGKAYCELSRLKYGRDIDFIVKELLYSSPEEIQPYLEASLKFAKNSLNPHTVETSIYNEGNEWFIKKP